MLHNDIELFKQVVIATGDAFGINYANEIEEIIMASQIILDNNKNHELYEQETAIEELKTSIKLVDNASTSNIFRQSFINIFSIFDAYVFENLKNTFVKSLKN